MKFHACIDPLVVRYALYQQSILYQAYNNHACIFTIAIDQFCLNCNLLKPFHMGMCGIVKGWEIFGKNYCITIVIFMLATIFIVILDIQRRCCAYYIHAQHTTIVLCPNWRSALELKLAVMCIFNLLKPTVCCNNVLHQIFCQTLYFFKAKM